MLRKLINMPQDLLRVLHFFTESRNDVYLTGLEPKTAFIPHQTFDDLCRTIRATVGFNFLHFTLSSNYKFSSKHFKSRWCGNYFSLQRGGSPGGEITVQQYYDNMPTLCQNLLINWENKNSRETGSYSQAVLPNLQILPLKQRSDKVVDEGAFHKFWDNTDPITYHLMLYYLKMSWFLKHLMFLPEKNSCLKQFKF